MTDYSQPSFYHFSRDSIELSHHAYSVLKDKKNLNVLDLACGSGVVGIEFSQIHSSIKSLTFVETQVEFNPYIKENCELFLENIPVKIENINVLDLKLESKYDLVLCNPPYFIEGSGRPADCKLKNRCHFMSEKEMEAFLFVMKNIIKNSGDAFFSSRTDQAFIKKWIEEKKILKVLDFGKSSIFKIA